MSGIIDILTGLIIIVGAVFTLVAALGILRFPDLYSRSHAASKAGTLGSGLLLAALALHSGELGVVTRALRRLRLSDFDGPDCCPFACARRLLCWP
jgi:multicomponent Na+:H+ antiporter subunit G